MTWVPIFTSPIHLYQLVDDIVKDRGEHFTISLLTKKDFSAAFRIVETNMNEIVLEADIKSALNVQYSSTERRVFFDVRYNEKLYNFSMVFDTKNLHGSFIRYFVQILLENTELRPVVKEDENEINRFIMYMSLDDTSVEADDKSNEVPAEYAITGRPDGGTNVVLRNSGNARMSLVLKRYKERSSLGMFELDNDCNFVQAIPSILNDKHNSLLAVDMLPINADKNLILLDEKNDKILYNLDLNRGEVINRYSTNINGVDQTVCKLMPTTSLGQDTTFLGYNSRNTMRFDPRVEGLVDKSEYKTDNHFTCGVTSTEGKLAMGSRNGIIRLYSAPCKTRATVNFQANIGNQPIISLDISQDGEWVVASCPHYVSLINTKNSVNGKLAFDSPLGANKPPCIRLSITQEHQQMLAKYHNGDLPPFTTAKFETSGSRIVSIIGTIGTGIVSWDFARIVAGKKPTYKISLLGGELIVDAKPIETTRNILFMSKNQVSMIDIGK